MRCVWNVLPLRPPPVTWHGKLVSDFAIRKLLGAPHGLSSVRQANVGIEKIFFTCDFHFIRDTLVVEVFPVVVFQIKDSRCWIIYWQSKPSLKLLDCDRKIQNSVYINALLTRTHAMTIHQYSSALHAFSVINVASRRRIDCSSVITHPVNFDIQWETSLNVTPRTQHIYIYIHRYHPR